MNETAAAHPDKQIQLWFQDEARFGQQGTVCRVWAECGSRPRRIKQIGYRWLYLFGSVCPQNGQTHACLLPWANTEVMNQYLQDFSTNLAADVHALLVMDGAGWHHPKALSIPENVTVLLLPPYSPELNPPELLWREMRQKHMSNLVYADEDELWAAVEAGWMALTADPAAIRKLADYPYILSARTYLN